MIRIWVESLWVKLCPATLNPKKACIFCHPMTRQSAEINAKRGEINSQKTKKINKMPRNNGKKNASNATNHHLSGCKNELQQASRKRIPRKIFSRIKMRLV